MHKPIQKIFKEGRKMTEIEYNKLCVFITYGSMLFKPIISQAAFHSCSFIIKNQIAKIYTVADYVTKTGVSKTYIILKMKVDRKKIYIYISIGNGVSAAGKGFKTLNELINYIKEHKSSIYHSCVNKSASDSDGVADCG